MLEPILQEYIRAFSELDRDSFCRQIGCPVLVAKVPKDSFSFQGTTTEMFPLDQQEEAKAGFLLRHHLPVLEVTPSGGGPAGQVSIGRSEENDLVIHDETVSSRHAILSFNPEMNLIQIEDLVSKNGTLLNGTLLVPGRAVNLKDGDKITFGDSEYVFFTPGGLYDEIGRILASEV